MTQGGDIMEHGLFFTAPEMPDLGGSAVAEDPVIFLAGPIQGGPDWQRTAAGIIHGIDPDMHVASPRRYAAVQGRFTDEMYYAQVDWEHHWLAYAGRHGAILFWLANEETHVCERAYAQTTRVELGWKFGEHLAHGTPVAVGFDTAFSNTRYLKYTLGKIAPGIPLLDSLQETCAAAVGLVHARHGATH